MKKLVRQLTAPEIEDRYRGTAAKQGGMSRNEYLLSKIMERVNEPAEAIRRAQYRFIEEQGLQRLRNEAVGTAQADQNTLPDEAFANEEKRREAIVKAQKAQGGITQKSLALRVGTTRERLSLWRKDRLATVDKTTRARDRIEAALLKILATSK